MKWQDLVFVVGISLLSASLIPTIRGKTKPALATSGLSVIVLSVFVFVDASLQLWYSALVTALSAVAWFILAVQKHRQLQRRK